MRPPVSPSVPTGAGPGRGLARSGVIFAIATGLSRIIGLVREIAQAAVFGISGPVNAFEIAFLIPNTVRSLVADSALSAAFVPVFSDLLVKGERKRAWRVASSIFWLMLLGLGGLTALFIVIAPWVMELFGYGPGQLRHARDRPRAHPLPARARARPDRDRGRDPQQLRPLHGAGAEPDAWNLIILLGLGLGVQSSSSESTRLYYYAVAILVATIVQFLLPLPWLRGLDGRLQMVIDIHDPAVKRTFVLMVPVTIGLGLININAVIDQLFATHYLDPTPRAGRDRAGVPPLHAAAGRVLGRRGDRPVPAPVATRVARGLGRLPATIATGSGSSGSCSYRPARRPRCWRRRSCASSTSTANFGRRRDDVVAPCLAAFALGLTFNGTMLMLNRGFFSLQSPWIPSSSRS